MPSIYIKLIIAILVIAFLKWAHGQVYDQGYNTHKTETLTAITKAVEVARAEERTKQGEVNELLKKQYKEQSNINVNLNNDLDKLRERASRDKAAKGKRSKVKCAGTTGKSLSFEDARFLTREAARADKIRNALNTCYSYADSVSN